MTLLRRIALLSLVVAFAHIVFGAIVRITGSGMGCGDNWPKCHGQWFPPLDRGDLIIEITHRWLAIVLLAVIGWLVYAAWRRRHLPGVAGPGGVLRAAVWSAVLWLAPAIFGAITVWLENPPGATVVHKLLAALLLAVLAAAVLRAGGLGARSLPAARASQRTVRAAYVAGAMALVVVALGGLTAKIPGAAPACQGFPLCNGQLFAEGGPQHVHMTHRIMAFLLFFHVMGMAIAITRRGEGALITRAAWIAFGAVLAQLVVAAAMVEMFLPGVLRSLHQAIGISIWLAIFTLAWLARASAHGGITQAITPTESFPEGGLAARDMEPAGTPGGGA